MRSICSQWLGYSWMCPLPLSGCTPDWLGASKNNCSEERGGAAHTPLAGDVCAPLKHNIWSNCSATYWHWLLLWSSQDLQPTLVKILLLRWLVRIPISILKLFTMSWAQQPGSGIKSQDPVFSMEFTQVTGGRGRDLPSRAQPEIIIQPGLETSRAGRGAHSEFQI